MDTLKAAEALNRSQKIHAKRGTWVLSGLRMPLQVFLRRLALTNWVQRKKQITENVNFRIEHAVSSEDEFKKECVCAKKEDFA
jgi:hypothetical protein